MANISITHNRTRVTIDLEGYTPFSVDMTDMTQVARGNYINRLMKWKAEGSKGFPPSP